MIITNVTISKIKNDEPSDGLVYFDDITNEMFFSKKKKWEKMVVYDVLKEKRKRRKEKLEKLNKISASNTIIL